MNIDLTKNFKITTNYNFKKYRNGILLQEENTHNILCNYLFTNNNANINGSSLYVGSGSGTPSDTDTALFTHLWNIEATSTQVTSHLATDNEPEEWCQILKKFTIPASTSYVATITECGLYGNGLLTHALLLDAEGNPISIEKTDLDVVIIEVTVRFYISSTQTIKTMPADKSLFLRFLQGAMSLKSLLCNNIEVLWSAALPLSGDDLRHWASAYAPTYYASYVSTTLPSTNDRIDTVKRQVNIQGARLGTDFPVQGQQFIKGLRVANTFIIPFPNEDIFPRYEISGMEVGVGDGESVEFICPMNYFIPDTDKIYIDGILQTRGVDYVVEADNNNQGIATLMACNEAKITGGYRAGNTGQGWPYYPMFRACLNGGRFGGYSFYGFYVGYNEYDYPDAFDTDRPLYIDMCKEVKINFWQIAANAESSEGVVYTLWVSDDGIDYVEVTSLTKTTNTVLSVTFDTIIKRYFKITVKSTSGSSNVQVKTKSVGAVSGESRCDQYGLQQAIDYNDLCLLGYKGHGIQFMNPPAAGSVITMDASTDLPMKNENFVFDVNLTLQY